MPFSIQIIPPSLRSNGPHCVKFPPAKPLLNMKSHWREGFYVVNTDEPQFWYNSGSFWPILFAQTIHFLLLMHAFLSLFVLFVGIRVDTLSTWLMHYDFRFFALKGRKDHVKRRQGSNEVALLVFRRGCPRSWGHSSWFPPRTPSSNPSPLRA